MTKKLGFSVFILAVAALALNMAGCGTSSTGSSSTTVGVATGTTAYTTCTTATAGNPQICMPELGLYGTEIVYTGWAVINATSAAGNFIHAVDGFQNDNITASSLANAYVVVFLNATASGPELSLTIQFPYALDSFQTIASYVFSGDTTFIPANGTQTADIGSILMQPPAINTNTSLKLISTQDWDGDRQNLNGVSILANGVAIGTVGLTQDYAAE